MNNLLQEKTDKMNDEEIKESLVELHKKGKYTDEETLVRVALLNTYDKRHGGQAMMDFCDNLNI